MLRRASWGRTRRVAGSPIPRSTVSAISGRASPIGYRADAAIHLSAARSGDRRDRGQPLEQRMDYRPRSAAARIAALGGGSGTRPHRATTARADGAGVLQSVRADGPITGARCAMARPRSRDLAVTGGWGSAANDRRAFGVDCAPSPASAPSATAYQLLSDGTPLARGPTHRRSPAAPRRESRRRRTAANVRELARIGGLDRFGQRPRPLVLFGPEDRQLDPLLNLPIHRRSRPRLAGSAVASARMTSGACSPLAPCTVITRTASSGADGSRTISTSPRSNQSRKRCSEGIATRSN